MSQSLNSDRHCRVTCCAAGCEALMPQCYSLPTNKRGCTELAHMVLTVGEAVRFRNVPECTCIASSNGGQPQVEVLEGGPAQTLAVSSILHAHAQSPKTQGCLAEGKESPKTQGCLAEGNESAKTPGCLAEGNVATCKNDTTKQQTAHHRHASQCLSMPVSV